MWYLRQIPVPKSDIAKQLNTVLTVMLIVIMKAVSESKCYFKVRNKTLKQS
jgi:hypothetical protein